MMSLNGGGRLLSSTAGRIGTAWARAVFHGKRGELRQRYREGQEDHLDALGLVVNILALWNTIYMDAVLEQLRIEGYALKPEDVARLSPLTFDHINFLGRYAFALPDSSTPNRSFSMNSVKPAPPLKASCA